MKCLEHIKPNLFAMQVGISFCILIFSMIQLGKGEPIEVYLPVITGISGYWLPQPMSGDSLSDKALRNMSDVAQASIAAATSSRIGIATHPLPADQASVCQSYSTPPPSNFIQSSYSRTLASPPKSSPEITPMPTGNSTSFVVIEDFRQT
jgi:hypothetical protein